MRDHIASICMFSLALASCGGEQSSDGHDDAGASHRDVGTGDDSGHGGDDGGVGGGDAGLDMNAGVDMSGERDMGAPPSCDWETVDRVLAFEAESLPLGESWETKTEAGGYEGSGYVEWTGNSHNNDPTHGVVSIDIRIDTPGRYQLDWRVQIGRGDDTTEHNDAWIRFPDADDYYGLKGQQGAEIRRYPRPICEDDTAMDQVTSAPDVAEATCPDGSTRDGWLKVYSSGARDWKWSARTSDNDASDVVAEFDRAGVYTLELAARANFFRIDRIVLREESVDAGNARSSGETPCD